MDTLITGLLEAALVLTGHVVVRTVTLGHWRAAGEGEARTYGAAGALSFRHQGRRHVTPTGQLFVGIGFYVALFVGLLAL